MDSRGAAGPPTATAARPPPACGAGGQGGRVSRAIGWVRQASPGAPQPPCDGPAAAGNAAPWGCPRPPGAAQSPRGAAAPGPSPLAPPPPSLLFEPETEMRLAAPGRNGNKTRAAARPEPPSPGYGERRFPSTRPSLGRPGPPGPLASLTRRRNSRPDRPARLPRAPLARGGSAGSLRRLPSAALKGAERAEDWAARPVQGPGEAGARTQPPPHPREGQGLQLPASPTAPPSSRQSAGAGGGTSRRPNGRVNGLGFSGSEVDLLISGAETLCEFIMFLQQLFRFSSIFRSAISIHLRRNIGLSAIVFNKAKELDPVQKLFIDKIREYNMKSQKAGGPADVSPEYQKDMAEEIAKIQRLYGGGDLTKFPDFKFEEPNFEEPQK